jgi:hypothetical protein
MPEKGRAVTSVPAESGAILRYTPESLANLPVPPVFLLKAGTRREKMLRDDWLSDHRARYHQAHSIRAQIERGLREFWDEATCNRFIPIVKSYWAARDQFDEQVRAMPDEEAAEAVFDFDGPATEQEITDLLERLADVDDRYNRMIADNRGYIGKAAVASAVFVLAGWEGLETAYARAGGCVTDEAFEDVARELEGIEADPANAGIEGISMPGTALMQLLAKCSERMFLSDQTRKNSQSPSPSSRSQPASNRSAAAGKSGKSPARARSRKTPAI